MVNKTEKCTVTVKQAMARSSVVEKAFVFPSTYNICLESKDEQASSLGTLPPSVIIFIFIF